MNGNEVIYGSAVIIFWITCSHLLKKDLNLDHTFAINTKTGDKFKLNMELAPRQKAILLAGGLLKYTGGKSNE